MNVVVASANPAKCRAAQRAFALVFPDQTLRIETCAVPSGVREQPLDDEETRRGARYRAQSAASREPDADFWVGMEGGLERLDGAWFASAWMAVRNREGRVGQARTPTLPLPPAVQALLDQGVELGEANDRVFGTVGSKQAGGAFGLLTDGRWTRGGVYAQTLELALLPLVHGLWRGAPPADSS